MNCNVSFTLDGNNNFPAAGFDVALEMKYLLPGAERQFPISNRNG
jgi:hypothetical protein